MSKIWLTIGLVGQLFFASRFVVQWLYSEIKKESTFPMLFWYLSIIGSVILLIYSIKKQDPVFIIGYSFNLIVYVRNIMLTNKNKND